MNSDRRDLGAATGWDEDHWIIQIRKNLAPERNSDDEDDEDDVPVCVFAVAKSLMADKPDAYVPLQVALGPYHQWRPQPSDMQMQRYKLLASRRIWRKLVNLRFEDIVNHFMKRDRRIRACYHRYLDLSTESLAWVMGRGRMSHVMDQSGNKTTQNAILRDIIMLENQIPLFLLTDLVSFVYHENPQEILASILLALCRCLSPFKSAADFDGRVHLLELLHFIAVPKQEEAAATRSRGSSKASLSGEENLGNCMVSLNAFLTFFKVFVHCVGKAFRLLKFKSVLKFCLRNMRVIGIFVALRRTSDEPLSSHRNNRTANESSKSSSTEASEVPLIEELMVPKVTQLRKAGVRFCATTGDLSTVKFDKRSGTFFLPAIVLDKNSEVVLRNMVAYEAGAATSSLVFTRYTELMDGIIDTEDDVKLLRKVGIIQNHLKSDKEVADLWNGMSKSVKLTKVAYLDKMIEELNAYYTTRWRIRAETAVKKYVFGCWPLLTFLAANLLIVTTTLQAICSIYDCKRTAFGSAAGKTNSTLA
ncbi:putative UPF0481 protein At3g02645 [Aristolochia californica]|uniref:putative UPF0481 protein At3g02645 n=1 Tax=Aristolochia californica TaxID=171875 RepID=UPI0035E177DC